MKIEGKTMTADEGMVLRRKVGYPLCGRVVHLGKVNIDGNIVEDKAEYWEEIAKKEPKFKFGRKEANNG